MASIEFSLFVNLLIVHIWASAGGPENSNYMPNRNPKTPDVGNGIHPFFYIFD
jgi:hypothetical protein